MPLARRSSRTYDKMVGSKVEVKRGVAHHTSGGLRAKDIMRLRDGRHVSKKKHMWGKRHGLKQLREAGYAPFRKGQAGVVRMY
jgi:hypothetical protein